MSTSAANNQSLMRVTKRNGELEPLSFDKILERITVLGQEASLSHINYTSLTMKVIEQLFDTISTRQLDELAAEQCAVMATVHPDYSKLAGRIIMSNHQKSACATLFESMEQLHNFMDAQGKHNPLVDFKLWEFTVTHRDALEAMLDYSRDYLIDYFGFKTLERSYLFRVGDRVVERVQHLWMRVAMGIHVVSRDSGESHEDTLARIRETYDLMSAKYFVHATPTLFNAGTPRPQLSSCYLVAMEEDSLHGIYRTLYDCAMISKYAGGIGLHVHNIRSTGTHIQGTNGSSNGLVPMLRVFNNTARYVDQGGGKRNGSIAVYLEPWHADVELFLEMKKNHGDEEMRARDLFYALWIPDLFMERVKNNQKWSLMCPHLCPGLSELYGDAFKAQYEAYEQEPGKVRKTIQARDLWLKMLDAQMETGTPYMLYKDAANQKNNQQNLGTIRSSNLCCEIMEYSDHQETAVCNLASIALPSFVDASTRTFQFAKLKEVTRVVTRNLNRVIDINYYPTEKTRRSNLRHRPIGIGVQGLADAFVLMDLPFHSEEARALNRQIFEAMYFAALDASCELAKRDQPYETFVGSPASQGKLQFDLWKTAPSGGDHVTLAEWEDLKGRILRHGLRNSLLMAPMPTASTSQILGFNECFEPFTSNLYTRRTIAGEFIVINKYLIEELMAAGHWNEDIKNNIVANKGSVQQLTFLPEHVRNKYKIVWEIPMRHVIDMAADRGPFICQSQSMNLWVEDPDYNTLTSMHFYAWKKGLKTGIYYLRRKAKHQPQQFTIAPPEEDESTGITDDLSHQLDEDTATPVVCRRKQRSAENEEDDEPCMTCSA